MRVLLFIIVLVFTVSAQTNFNGEYEKALQKYRSQAPSDAAGVARQRYNIGVCLYRLGRHEEAVTELKEAARIDPNYQKAFYALGMAEAAGGNPVKAKTAFARAVDLKKTDAEAWFDLGLVLIELKEFPEARAAFANSAKFGSINAADAHNNIGVIHALNGDIASAIKEFKISGSEEAKGNIAYCRNQLGRLSIAGTHR